MLESEQVDKTVQLLKHRLLEFVRHNPPAHRQAFSVTEKLRLVSVPICKAIMSAVGQTESYKG